MQSELGHYVVSYMVMSVLEEHSGFLFIASGKMEAVYALIETSVPTSRSTQSHNLEDGDFESQYSAFSVHCITITSQLNTHIWQ
jgi:hypothetical protein